MTEIGQLEIGASLNTKQLDEGVRRTKQSLKEIGDSSNSVDNDLKRAEKSAASFGRKLATAGTVGAGVLAGMAAKAPATAGAMARIKVATGELSRSIGEALAPAFDSVATGIQKLADYAQSNPINLQIGLTGAGLLAGGGLLASLGLGSGLLGAAGTGIGAASIAGGLTVGGALGIGGGILGAAGLGLLGGGLGGKAVEWAGGERGSGAAITSAVGTGGLAGAGVGAAVGTVVPVVGNVVGAVAGAIIGAIAGGIGEYLKGRNARESKSEADLYT